MGSIRTHFDPAVILLSLGDPKEKKNVIKRACAHI